MEKYRIIEHTCYNGKCFEVQKRFLGFLWWHNFNNIDGITTGIYDTLEEAEEAIKIDRFICTGKICKTYN